MTARSSWSATANHPTTDRRCRRSTSPASSRASGCSCGAGSSISRVPFRCASACARRPLIAQHSGFGSPTASELAWDKLLLCVGSRARRLDVPGAELPGHPLPANHRRRRCNPREPRGARRLVVVGAGYIGLEAAASARHLGLEVTVLEAADRPMQRVVCPALSEFYRRGTSARACRSIATSR